MVAELLIAGICILDLWAIVVVLRSSASSGAKTIWCSLVFFLPIIGFMLRFMFGPEEDPTINEAVLEPGRNWAGLSVFIHRKKRER